MALIWCSNCIIEWFATNTIDGHIFIFILCPFSCVTFCSLHVQHINKLSLLRLSQGGFSLSCKLCATSIFNILITYHSLDSIREPSLSCKQCATSVFNTLITYHSLLGVKEPFLSLSQKQCATSVFNILIIYHFVLGVKEVSLH